MADVMVPMVTVMPVPQSMHEAVSETLSNPSPDPVT